MKLEEKVALITGAGSGIGRAIALLFAEEGACVAVNDLRREVARQTVEALGSRAGQGFAIPADVSDSGQVRTMFAEIEQRFGQLDILVNNAGIAIPPEQHAAYNRKAEAYIAERARGGPIQTHFDVTVELTDEEWHRMLGVHLNGTFFCTREALKLMSRRNRGVIINISSVAALRGGATVPHYSAAKGGILSFTRAVAQEVASRNIRVNAICPGWIDTPMTEGASPLLRAAFTSMIPMARYGRPREVATTALFLASDDSSYFTGQWLSPGGGLFIG